MTHRVVFINFRTTDIWAARLGRRSHQTTMQPTGEFWSKGCLLGESYSRWKWLGPCTSPWLSHLLGYHKRSVISVTTTDHWPHPKLNVVSGSKEGQVKVVNSLRLTALFEAGSKFFWAGYLSDTSPCLPHKIMNQGYSVHCLISLFFLWTLTYFFCP